MRLLKLIAALATVSIVGGAAAQADVGPPWGPETPHFNLEAILRPAAGGPDGAFGLVKFRQPNDAAKVVYLDTWVRDLTPKVYYLQRATDLTVDDNCMGTNWLTLGQITTDATGSGRAALSRDLSAVQLGMAFDIRFRIVETPTATAPPVLESGCYQFTVSQ
jgi:hypothetical protein